jgi:hypothetical protein
MASSSQIPPLTEVKRPHFKTHVLERTKIWSWVPTGPETKIDSAAEAQQQFTQPNQDCGVSCMTPRVVRQKNTVMSAAGSGTKNNCAGEGQHRITALLRAMVSGQLPASKDRS